MLQKHTSKVICSTFISYDLGQELKNEKTKKKLIIFSLTKIALQAVIKHIFYFSSF